MKNKTNAETLALRKLGRTIRAYRNKIRLSQEELAAEADVHRTYIGMIERGEKNVTFLTILRLSKTLNVDASELLEEFSNGK